MLQTGLNPSLTESGPKPRTPPPKEFGEARQITEKKSLEKKGAEEPGVPRGRRVAGATGQKRPGRSRSGGKKRGGSKKKNRSAGEGPRGGKWASRGARGGAEGRGGGRGEEKGSHNFWGGVTKLVGKVGNFFFQNEESGKEGGTGGDKGSGRGDHANSL